MTHETKKAAKARQIIERAEAKKTMLQQLVDRINSTPIAKAVAPLKIDAMNRAEQDERKYIESVRIKLAEVGGNLDIIAPRPRHNCGREEYMIKSQHRAEIKSFCKVTQQPRNFHDETPTLVEICPEATERHVANTRERMGRAYDAFVHKLVDKVGGHTDASISGNHVWGYSYLTVTLSNGEKEVWKTQ